MNNLSAKVREEARKLLDDEECSVQIFYEAADTIEQQATLITKYREALEFYADKETYYFHPCTDGDTDVMDDAGERARNALQN